MDEPELDYAKLFLGYKPNPPRQREEWTQPELRKFADYIVILNNVIKKIELKQAANGITTTLQNTTSRGKI